jgi:hypothetical protein
MVKKETHRRPSSMLVGQNHNAQTAYDLLVDRLSDVDQRSARIQGSAWR